MLVEHVFLGLPAAKPRVWVDLSSAASKRAGLALHRPGRKMLQWAVEVLGWFAWMPIGRLRLGPVKKGAELDGVDLLERMVDEAIAFITYYTGNDSEKSKYTIQVRTETGRNLIVKLGKTPAAGRAIRQEAEVLARIAGAEEQAGDGAIRVGDVGWVPRMMGPARSEGVWTWSVQTVLRKGKSAIHFNDVHRRFLAALQDRVHEGGRVLVHGDFAPWNMSVVDGRLCVYDWEDAHMGAANEDEKWFRRQVRALLGVEG